MKWRLPLALGLALISGFLARGVAFNADPTAHFPRESASVNAWLDLSLRFDAFNTLIIGLEEPAAPLMGLERVKRITDRLTALKANGVLAVASVTNVESIREGTDGSLETELLIAKLPGDKAELDALAAKIDADPQVSGALISRDQQGYVIVLRADPRRDPAELAAAIRAVVEEARGPLLATYFGAAFFQAVIARTVLGQLKWLIPAIVLLLFAVLALLVRDARAIARVLLPAALSLIVWLAAVRVGGIELTPTSITAGALLFVLATLTFARAHESGPPWTGLMAIAAGSLALLAIPQLVTLAMVLALGIAAIALVLLVVGYPRSSRAESRDTRPPALALVIAAIALAGFSALARNAHFHGTPQTLFSAKDDVGASMSFFDRRFGGPDFIQVAFRGDLRDPELAARLLRVTDLLEGPDAFGDVRAVAPILGFLNHGFGGVHRIPASRESLNNLWFFLEGRPDVRNLVSDKRDEAMIVLRVPSKLPRPIGELSAIVDTAVAGSLEQGRASTKLRLEALASLFALPTTRLDEVLDAPGPDTRPAVNAAIQKWLASGDSPFQPTEPQWKQLEAALGEPDREAKLTAVASSFSELSGDPQHAAQLVESVLAREKDLRLDLHALALVDRMWDRAAPPAARVRAQGIFADHLDPHAGPGTTAAITVTGLPIVSAQIERDVLSGLWRALGLLCVAGAVALLVLTRKAGATLGVVFEATLAAAITLAIAGALGLGLDPGSLALFLLPPLAAFLVSGSARLPAAFCLAIAAASTPLLFVGVLPISRVGSALAITLAAVALIHQATRRASSAPSSRP